MGLPNVYAYDSYRSTNDGPKYAYDPPSLLFPKHKRSAPDEHGPRAICGLRLSANDSTGKERDSESGLDYFGARYYGSALGRFTSPDWSDKLEPIPYANLLDPQTLNLYAYVRNNPLSKPDPDGHCPSDDSAACSANLSVKQVSAIVQNEMQSLHDKDAKNPQLDTMKKDVAHAVINGDNKLGDKRPITAPDTVSDKQAKSDSFKATEKDVQCACQEAKQGTDPTSGATHFNLRPNDSEKDFQGAKIQTHDGPFSNSYPSAALPKGKDVYVNTYKDQPSPASKKDQDQ